MDKLAQTSYAEDEASWLKLLRHFGGIKKGCPKGVVNGIYTRWYLTDGGASYKSRWDQDL